MERKFLKNSFGLRTVSFINTIQADAASLAVSPRFSDNDADALRQCVSQRRAWSRGGGGGELGFFSPIQGRWIAH